MGALGVEGEILCSFDYSAFGIKVSTKDDNLGKPLVLSLLTSFLERSIQRNERNLETSQSKDSISVFDGLRAPPLSIRQYIDRIFKYSCCSPSCFVIAHVYLDRFVQQTSLLLTSFNVHRLIISSVMVAAKFMDDAFFNNAHYARVGGISTSEMNNLEMEFLFGVNFRLHVSVETFRKYCSVLKGEFKGLLIERPIKACRLKPTWANKDEPLSPRTISR